MNKRQILAWVMLLGVLYVGIFAVISPYAGQASPSLMAFPSAYEQAIASSVTVITSGGSCGSGFAVGDGLIVTAKHVVEGCDFVAIVISDGSTHAATVRYESTDNDIAVLEYLGDRLPPLNFGAAPRVGDTVFTVGSPFGIDELRLYMTHGTAGIVDRNVPGIGESVIITDTPVNPGNSGGALFNNNGEVVGIVLATILRADGVGICLSARIIEDELKGL